MDDGLTGSQSDRPGNSNRDAGAIMRRVIDGKLYDTDTATLIHTIEWFKGFGKYVESLYVTENGAYFLFESLTGFGSITRTEISPFSRDGARRWCEKYCTVEIISEFFNVEPA